MTSIRCVLSAVLSEDATAPCPAMRLDFISQSAHNTGLYFEVANFANLDCCNDPANTLLSASAHCYMFFIGLHLLSWTTYSKNIYNIVHNCIARCMPQ